MTLSTSSKLVKVGVFIALIAIVVAAAAVGVLLKPWNKTSSPGLKPAHQQYLIASTPYGGVRGLTYKVSDEENIDVFFGIPFARPPVGELRFARPEPVSAWKSIVRNATSYPNMCLQQNTKYYNLTTASEDCLYVNIYSPRKTGIPEEALKSNFKLPVMFYIHGGSFRDGSSIYYNYTNLAMKGVVVVTTNYRLDALGFLSTQDDIIPGNFGLLDVALSLEFIREVISSFRGNPNDVTVFGASAGSAMVSQMALSPLTRGKFQKAILQSGPGTSYWASYKPGYPNAPRQVALDLGKKLNCNLTRTQSERNQSQALLTCLRDQTPKNLIDKVADLTKAYNSDIIFVPVSGDAFGFLPQTPSELAANYTNLVPIPTIFGWSSNDSSWTVQDRDNNGENYDSLVAMLNAYISILYPTQPQNMLQKALEIYNITDPTKLSPYDVRAADIKFRTDLFMESFIAKEARQFSRAAAEFNSTTGSKVKTFVYQYDYRPSYKTNPLWQGVTHMDERGMVMGLPNGPNPFTYPVTNQNDRIVGEMMTTMWSNFAKFGDPTPDMVSGIKWPVFGHKSGDQSLLKIRPNPEVRQFDRYKPVVLWTKSSGLDDD